MAAASATSTQLNGNNSGAAANTAAAGGGGAYDMYDFSGVSSDLAILRSQLFTLNVGEKPPNNHHAIANNSQWDILHDFCLVVFVHRYFDF